MKDPVELKQLVDTLNKLSDLLYSFDGCLCGGPLHIVLDDGNMLDQDMTYSREWVSKNEHKHAPAIIWISLGILSILERFSPAQRRLWWYTRLKPTLIDRMAELHDKTYIEDNHCELVGYEPWQRENVVPFTTSTTVARALGLSDEELREICERFFSMFPELRAHTLAAPDVEPEAK